MSLKYFSELENFDIVRNVGYASDGCKVIMVSAYNITNISTCDYETLLKSIFQWLDISSGSEFYLVYFHEKNLTHDGIIQLTKQQLWLKNIFSSVLRIGNKENTKKIFVVHPDVALRTLWRLIAPISFIKYAHKINYVNSLCELRQELPLCEILFHIPISVLERDKLLTENCASNLCKKGAASFSSQVFQTAQQIEKRHKAQDCFDKTSKDGILFEMQRCVKYLFSTKISPKTGLVQSERHSISCQQVIDVLKREISIDTENLRDPHFTCNLFREMLESMAEPPFTFSLYEDIVAFNKLQNDQKMIAAKKIVLYQLPKKNYELLVILLTFLSRLLELNRHNKTSTKNIVSIFAPLFVKPKEENSNLTAAMIEMHVVVEFVFFLLEHFYEIIKTEV